MQHRKRQITLKQRMGLCLAAFFAAFAMQLTLNGYQSRAVQAVQDAQMGCFNAISRFQGGVESSISVLENYRWENSEPEEIIDRLQSASSTCNAWLWRIGTSLNSLESVSDEQQVLWGGGNGPSSPPRPGGWGGETPPPQQRCRSFPAVLCKGGALRRLPEPVHPAIAGNRHSGFPRPPTPPSRP